MLISRNSPSKYPPNSKNRPYPRIMHGYCIMLNVGSTLQEMLLKSLYRLIFLSLMKESLKGDVIDIDVAIVWLLLLTVALLSEFYYCADYSY